MSEAQVLTGPEIMSQLAREAERFYKKFDARDPSGAAGDFQWVYRALFRNIREWTASRPQLPEKRRTKGRKLFEPSQDRSRILTELKDLADILDSVVKRRLSGKAKHGRPRARTKISSDACEAILGPSSVRKGLFAPLREQTSEKSPDNNFKEAQIWGHDDWRTDAILTKRASAQMARDPTIAGYGLAAVQRRLFPVTARRLLVASNRFRQDVPILAFVDAMDPASIRNLAENARQAERELRVAFGIEHLDKNVQPNHTMTDFGKPAPLYRFISAALEAGWRFNGQESLMFEPICVHDRERLLVGASGREFEAALVKLIKRAMEWTKQIAPEFFGMENVDLFVGIDVLEILNNKALTREDNDLEQEVPSAISRIALRIVRLREQIIVLRDHAATLWHWHELICARAETDATSLDDAEFLLRNAFYKVSEWARECEHHYYEGVFYATDRRRRASGTPVKVNALSVELLRRQYTQSDLGGPRWADVTAKQMGSLLGCLYNEDDPVFVRLSAIFEKHFATHKQIA